MKDYPKSPKKEGEDVLKHGEQDPTSQVFQES
jgi:hypothetical protein